LKTIYYKYLFIILCCCVIVACASLQNHSIKLQIITATFAKNKPLTEEEKIHWQHKDIIEDTIPGISLDKCYRELLSEKKGDTIIVAVLDTGLDIYHEEFEKIIWKNDKELVNGIDDDNNGYIDDISGWNFLGNKKGENVEFTNYECLRIVKAYDSIFNNKTKKEIVPKDTLMFKQYIKALEQYNSKLKNAKEAFDTYNIIVSGYQEAVEVLKPYIPDEKFTLDKLNSISTKDERVQGFVKEMKTLVENNITYENLLYKKKWATVRYKNHLGVGGYNESDIIGDNPKDINDKHYGNNKVYGNEDTRYHSTQVTGVLAADRSNDKGIKGVTNVVKIMPVRLASLGSERDKDIALSIRYAVDNGAKIINMSFSNEFSLRRKWVDDAIKYAANNDVLIITTAGNNRSNIDVVHNNYPNDQIENGQNFVDNFIVVGASWYKLDENLAGFFSSYGKENVDIFAPGQEICTSTTGNKYKYTRGTSVATPLVSGIAALIRSYYPNLTASEVKQIIMESGVSYDIMVNKPSTSKEKELVPFSSLSKSGKIVNAYNALLLAEEVSKKKKK